MEISGILWKKIVRRKIRSASKPAVAQLTGLVVQFEITPVGVDRRYKRIQRMNYERQSAGEPFGPVNFQLRSHGIRYVSKNNGRIHSGFFENMTILHDPCFTSTLLFRSLPAVFFEFRVAVCFFKGTANPVLQCMYMMNPALTKNDRH